MFKDKLFFFGAQEWVNYFAVSDQHGRRADRGDAQRRLQPAARARTRSSARPRSSATRSTGQPFPGNIIPTNRLSPNGVALMNALSAADRRDSSRARTTRIVNSDNPQDQRKDNIRFDYRLNQDNQFTYRYSKLQLGGGRRVPRHVPVRAHRLGPAELDAEPQLDAHVRRQPDQRVQLLVLDRPGVHQRLHGVRPLSSAAARGSTIPYIFPDGRRSRTRSRRSTIDTFTGIDGGPYPSSSEGPIHVFSNATTYVKGRHTFKAGISVEYSGEDDFDQINVNSIPGGTNNQNGQFEFRNSTSGPARASASRTWRWASSPTTRRSVSARSPSGGRSRPTSSSRTRGSRPATSRSRAASAGRSGRRGTRRRTTSRTSTRGSTTRPTRP